MLKKLRQMISKKFIPIKEFVKTDGQGYVHLSSFFINIQYRGVLKCM